MKFDIKQTAETLVEMEWFVRRVAKDVNEASEIWQLWIYLGGALAYLSQLTRRSPEQHIAIVTTAQKWFLSGLRDEFQHIAVGILRDHDKRVYSLIEAKRQVAKEARERHANLN